MKTFDEYLEDLCRQHPAIQHKGDEDCHFASSHDDSASKFASLMHYPCVIHDSGDFVFHSAGGTTVVTFENLVLFLDHVSDSGNNKEIQDVLKRTKKILMDFMKKFSRDKKKLAYTFLNRFSAHESEGHRITFKDAGLWGWALFIATDENFIDQDCDKVFID